MLLIQLKNSNTGKKYHHKRSENERRAERQVSQAVSVFYSRQNAPAAIISNRRKQRNRKPVKPTLAQHVIKIDNRE